MYFLLYSQVAPYCEHQADHKTLSMFRIRPLVTLYVLLTDLRIGYWLLPLGTLWMKDEL